MTPEILAARLDLQAGVISGAPVTRRWLADLKGLFADGAACDTELAQGNPLLYSVSNVEAAQGDGQLHYALGMLLPGKIGREYYFTKGHLHAWRAAAEVYLGLRGAGLMLLEDERDSRVVPLRQDAVVYVPGHTAHRTINTGREPLLYLGVYPAGAGHDYEAIARRNFRKAVVEQAGRPIVLDRSALTHEPL
jgi:glucose-6-phosphate isomerase, archaeal